MGGKDYCGNVDHIDPCPEYPDLLVPGVVVLALGVIGGGVGIRRGRRA